MAPLRFRHIAINNAHHLKYATPIDAKTLSNGTRMAVLSNGTRMAVLFIGTRTAVLSNGTRMAVLSNGTRISGQEAVNKKGRSALSFAAASLLCYCYVIVLFMLLLCVCGPSVHVSVLSPICGSGGTKERTEMLS